MLRLNNLFSNGFVKIHRPEQFVTNLDKIIYKVKDIKYDTI